jgi:putative aminopeptidase FrvX
MTSKKMKQLLEKSSNLKSLPSFEGEVNLWLKKQISDLPSVKVKTSINGTLYAVKGNPLVGVISHLDKIGFMVKSELKPGVYEILPLGNVKFSKGQLLKVWGNHGPVGVLNIDTTAKESKYVLETGGQDKNEKILSGTPVGIIPGKPIFQNGCVIDSWLDNKIGFLLGLELVKACPNILFIGARKEEVGQSTAAAVSAKIKALKLLIDLDTTWDNGYFGEPSVQLGGGSSICLKDDLVPNSELISFIQKIIQKKKLKVQYELLNKGESDLSLINSSAQDVMGVFIGIPLKFMHTANEIVCLDDTLGAFNLIKEIISSFKNFKYE